MLFADASIEDLWFWVTLWKVLFVCAVSGFAGMAVWVTIGGVGDIKRLFARINAEHEQEERQQSESE